MPCCLFCSGNPAFHLEARDEVFRGISCKGLILPGVHVFTQWLQFPPTVQRHADYRSTGNSTAPVGVNVFVSLHAFAENWHEAGSGTLWTIPFYVLPCNSRERLPSCLMFAIMFSSENSISMSIPVSWCPTGCCVFLMWASHARLIPGNLKQIHLLDFCRYVLTHIKLVQQNQHLSCVVCIKANTDNTVCSLHPQQSA